MVYRTLLLALLVASSLAAPASGQVIYSDDFSGDAGSSLNGTAPDTRPGAQTWSSSDLWNADGSKSAATTGTAWLPFTPASGNIYQLSLTVNPDVSASDDWMALGFSEAAATTVFHEGVNNTAAWMLNRENDASSSAIQTFLGPVTAGGESHDPIPDLVGPVNLEVVLDTRPALWSVEWLANGTSLRTGSYTTANPAINFVGFGGYSSATGTVDNFTLTVVPEPGGLALLGGAVAAGLTRRRRRTV